MINLLPPSHIDKIRYGKKTAALMKRLMWVGLANLGLLLVLFFGWVYIDRQSDNISSQIDFASKQLKTQNLDQVEKQSKEITNNVRTINQVLSKEVLFSQLIQEVGRIVPSGAILGSISLTQVSSSVDLIINSKDHNSAIQASANLSDPENKLFEEVDILNVNCTGSTPDYPCVSTFKALFSKSAQDRFLNVAKGTTP